MGIMIMPLISSLIETITAYIVQVSQGDVARDSLEFKTIYAAGAALFVVTFALNNVGYWIRTRAANAL